MNTKDNSGALWGNKDRQTDKHPHFKGQCVIDGVEYWVSGWKRDPDNQNPKAPALRLSFTAKDEAHKQGVQGARQAVESAKPMPPLPEFDDDIPF